MVDRVGEQFSDYRLIRLIGRGGFADVYLGEHLRRQSLAAIKVLHTQLTNNTMKVFLNEARSFRLRHPHIVQLLDFGVEDDIPFLVMDYAPNGSLRRRYPKGIQLPLPTIVSYVKQIAGALQYAHDEGIIHRDIKPDNMLLGQQNEVLLSDFGIASIVHTTQSLNIQNQAGTITYMAPEQIQGKPRPASDQYSLGIVVYEWICGDRPFQGAFVEIYHQHLSVSPPSLHEQVPNLPSEVEQIVMTALAKDPKARFANVQAFANALEQASHIAGQLNATSLLGPPSSLLITATASEPSIIPSRVDTSSHHTPPMPHTFSTPQQLSVNPNAVKQQVQSPSEVPPITPLQQDQTSLISVPFSELHPTTSTSATSPDHAFPPQSHISPLHLSASHSRWALFSQPRAINYQQFFSPGRVFLLIGLVILVIAGSVGFLYLTNTNQLSGGRINPTSTARLNAAQISPTPNLTATANRGETATAQARANATAGVISTATSGKLVYQDSLKNLNNPVTQAANWDEDDHCAFASDGYHVKEGTNWHGCKESADQYQGGTISVDTRILSGHSGGLFFRITTNIFNQYAGYLFEVDSAGRYRISVSQNYSTGSITPLQDWTASRALKQGYNVTNTLQLIARGSTLLFYVNGVFLVQLTDTTFISGVIAFLASSNGTPTEVVYSNLNIYSLA